ncbi:MAG TPA: glutamate formimidoyltransferase [Firmicutes bacterium]|nr:MAG: glutamate formiminotransferase [Peptococcaceae bacterium 1109]HHT72812.1 glutamate formimidoyltransferase [Bacillota bacterium]
MSVLVQCVPNISEGRRQDVVEAVVDEVRKTTGVHLLDYSSDADHNRSVITFVGDLASVSQACLALARKAVAEIDMNQHAGAHPRIGAVDVVPLIPIERITLKECAQGAWELGQRLWDELGLPVYFYGEAAKSLERANLSNIRKGQYEGLKAATAQGERLPDVGGPQLHPTAGAVAVGARMPLIAFNVNLGTGDKSVADTIARAVRARNGGFATVKAMGVYLEDRNQVQVSMNLENYKRTPMYRVLETIRREAARFGVPVVGTEIVGLVPQEALLEAAEWYLQVEDFCLEQVLENRLRNL